MRSAALRDVSKLLTGSVVAKLFGLASTMLFARMLSKDELATFPIYLMLAGAPNLVLSFGIFSTFMRELPRLLRDDEERARALILTGSAVIIGSTVLVAGLSLFWVEDIARFAFRDPGRAWVIAAFAPGFVAYVVAKIGEYVVASRGQFARVSGVQIVESVARPVFTIALFLLFGFPGLVVGLVAAQFLIAGLYVWFMRDLIFRPVPRPYPLKRLLGESAPYYVGNYLSFLRGDGDNLLITALLGPSALAVYYVAKNLFSNVLMVQTAIDSVAVERLARAGPEEFQAKLSALNERIGHVMVPFTLLIIAVAPYAIRVLAGPGYEAATLPAIVLLFAALAQFLAIPPERAVFVAAPGVWRMYLAFFEVAIVLGAAALLAPALGVEGVAGARVLSALCGCVFALALMRWKLGLTLSYRTAALAGLAGGPVTLAVLILAPRPHDFFSAVVEGAVVGCVWLSAFAAATYFVNRPLAMSVATRVRQQFRGLNRS